MQQRDDWGFEDDVLSAGKLAPAGQYRRVDVPWGRVVVLEQEGQLPASFDGHVALYRKIIPLFPNGDLRQKRGA